MMERESGSYPQTRPAKVEPAKPGSIKIKLGAATVDGTSGRNTYAWAEQVPDNTGAGVSSSWKDKTGGRTDETWGPAWNTWAYEVGGVGVIVPVPDSVDTKTMSLTIDGTPLPDGTVVDAVLTTQPDGTKRADFCLPRPGFAPGSPWIELDVLEDPDDLGGPEPHEGLQVTLFSHGHSPSSGGDPEPGARKSQVVVSNMTLTDGVLAWETYTIDVDSRGHIHSINEADGGGGSIVGPKGDTGDKGDKGDTGDTGPAGANGTPGATGATGAKGDKGDKGDTGATGAAGATGATGAPGEDGADGAKGDKGDKGDPGEKGDKGDPGDPPSVDDIAAAIVAALMSACS